jgi:hypothetical protein
LQDSDDLTEFVCLCDHYKPKDINLLTELEQDVEGDFDCNKKAVHSFSCSAEVQKVDTALNRIDLEPSLRDEVQENEPTDLCDDINLESVLYLHQVEF